MFIKIALSGLLSLLFSGYVIDRTPGDPPTWYKLIFVLGFYGGIVAVLVGLFGAIWTL